MIYILRMTVCSIENVVCGGGERENRDRSFKRQFELCNREMMGIWTRMVLGREGREKEKQLWDFCENRGYSFLTYLGSWDRKNFRMADQLEVSFLTMTHEYSHLLSAGPKLGETPDTQFSIGLDLLGSCINIDWYIFWESTEVWGFWMYLVDNDK